MKKHIVLYNPQQKQGEKKDDISLALLSIAAMPYKKGYKIDYINSSDENSLAKMVHLSKNALCVGFCVMTGYPVKDALNVSKEIKNRYPDTTIVWGGWHPSILPEQTIVNEFIDIITIGQGQKTFAELVDTLENGTSLDNVKGIMYKQDGKIIKTEPRQFEDINNFLPINYDIIEGQKFITNVDELATRTISYFSSQGCPHRCRFCADPLVYKHRTTMLKPQRVIEDIDRFVKDYAINGVICTDTNFFVDEERVKEICMGLIKKGIKIKWGSMNGRTEHLLRLSDETWRLLKQCNFSSFLIGAESGNDESLKFIQKDATVQHTIDLTKRCKDYGFKIYYSLMLGLPPNPDSNDSYPMQIKKDWIALLKLIDDVFAISKDHMFYFLIYTPYPGTPFYEICLKNGYRDPGSLEEWGKFALDKANTPWVPKKYVLLIDQLNVIFIPFLTNSFFVKFKKYGPLGKLAKMLFLPLYWLVMLRWKFKIFSLPWEYHMVKFSKKIARKCILRK